MPAPSPTARRAREALAEAARLRGHDEGGGAAVDLAAYAEVAKAGGGR